MATYTNRAHEMVHLRCVEGLTLQGIGDRFGVTRERVRQIISAKKELPPILASQYAAYTERKQRQQTPEAKRALFDRIVSMRAEGYSYRTIAQKTGVSHSRVALIIKNMQVP